MDTAAVNNGKVADNGAISSTKTSIKGSSNLGKDAFLQLLVAQMKYQDPLEPSSDTEWIAQLAQFSSLEEMQNMSSTLSNTQAFTMVGKTVNVVSDGKTIEGVVDSVSLKGSTAYVSVNGNSYKASDVTAVLGETYLQNKYGPRTEKQDVTFDYDDPKDIKISLSMGDGNYAASGVYVAINGKLIDGSNMEYDEKNGILTIKKEAISGLGTNQKYDIAFIFDDSASTTISGKVTLSVKGTQPETPEGPEAPDETDKTEETETKDEV